MSDYTELKEAAEKATPGPWENEPNTGAGRVWVRSTRWRGILMDCEPIFNVRAQGGKRDDERKQRAKDAAFIAAADPTTILSLIADLATEQQLRRDRDEDLIHEFGLRDKAEHDLAAAEKVIGLMYEAVLPDRSKRSPNESRRAALAAYDDWKGADDAT